MALKISIIIPTYNEANSIVSLLDHLKKYDRDRVAEIIVADGGSSDNTVLLARESGVICIESEQKGRAAQMNAGYRHATGDLLYFVHADSLPPASYTDDLLQAIEEGYPSGCYRFRFNSDRFLLKVNSYFTRFDRIMCRGGDQTLFVTRNLFEELGGFRDDYIIMEDYDLIEKLQRAAPFKIIPKDVIVSARKYDNNYYLQVNLANLVVFMMYFAGAGQQTMVNTYKKLIQHPKF